MPKFHTLKVADVRAEAPDTVSIAFDVPDQLAGEYKFIPGQYLTLKTDIGGEEVRRTYSICSGLHDDELRVAIRKVDGGLFSSFANDDLAAGAELDVMTPDGRFTLEPSAENAGRYVAFAAGSGITPIISIAKAVLQDEPNSTFTLVYGNRSAGTMIFREELEDLKNVYHARFSLVHVLSREMQEAPMLSGRIDAEKAAFFADKLLNPEGTDAFYLCGPEDMIQAVRSTLEEKGVDAKKIRMELFTPADGGNAKPKPVLTEEEKSKLAKRQIAVVIDGRQTEFEMLDDGSNILDAAMDVRSDLPYACKGGMCCTCRAKLIEGEVTMEKTYALEPEEIEAGYVLTCQAVPTTDRVKVDFDQR